MSVIRWDEDAVPANREEEVLLLPLLHTLRRRRWVGPRSVVRTEFAWHGRRVDLATLGIAGSASAYELKLGSFHRVLEQAMYNRLSFDRSWIVVRERPLERNAEQARENGIGIILLTNAMTVVSGANRQHNSPSVRMRLAASLRKELR